MKWFLARARVRAEFIGHYSPRRADIIMQIARGPRNRANTRSDESVAEVNARWIVWSRGSIFARCAPWYINLTTRVDHRCGGGRGPFQTANVVALFLTRRWKIVDVRGTFTYARDRGCKVIHLVESLGPFLWSYILLVIELRPRWKMFIFLIVTLWLLDCIIYY